MPRKTAAKKKPQKRGGGRTKPVTPVKAEKKPGASKDLDKTLRMLIDEAVNTITDEDLNIDYFVLSEARRSITNVVEKELRQLAKRHEALIRKAVEAEFKKKLPAIAKAQVAAMARSNHW